MDVVGLRGGVVVVGAITLATALACSERRVRVSPSPETESPAAGPRRRGPGRACQVRRAPHRRLSQPALFEWLEDRGQPFRSTLPLYTVVLRIELYLRGFYDHVYNQWPVGVLTMVLRLAVLVAFFLVFVRALRGKPELLRLVEHVHRSTPTNGQRLSESAFDGQARIAQRICVADELRIRLVDAAAACECDLSSEYSPAKGEPIVASAREVDLAGTPCRSCARRPNAKASRRSVSLREVRT